MHKRFCQHRAIFVGAALALTLSGVAGGSLIASAVTQETEAQLTETQKQVEASASAYSDACAQVNKLQDKINENAARISELESKLPAQRQRASRAMRASYKHEQSSNSFMTLVLNAESFEDFLTRMNYLDQINASNTRALDELTATEAELEQQRLELEQAKSQAQAEQAKADAALKEAQALRQAAERRAAKEAENELRALQEAAAQQAGGQGQTPVVIDATTVDWSLSVDDFVALWAPRINAYLEGSPLAGYGENFARAAWTYGVDPRWSPAISNTESSKGQHLFREHNAWGWGHIDFASWEEAIDTHVRGLAEGYGYTISVQGAQKYCPPNWFAWYNNTVAEMNKI
ncbi:hypothetical protein KPC83_03395 [Collinsella sp. zg1085]|uniref:coiled-coil domain-containing protein n=1 Tax=Collinsella sp. zg1085 TaxID=2844380 RepID=UPI001C0C28CD|nr:hypothetical protein [Collinsella sp. zg1085]QWT18188.1 hypothetical protein KPC83_03395 [Collinsella sp. zg1085]